jgi:uncharacterized lipoprotein YajG
MNELIAALVTLFVKTLTDFIQAADDRAKQEAAIMTAEEELATLRARAKFGQAPP